MSRYLKRFGSILVMLLLPGLILSGCNKNTSSNQAEKTGQPGSSVQVLHKVHAETFYDENDGTILLKAKITVPEIANPTDDKAINAINQYYQTQIDSFMNSIRGEDLQIARADKEFTQSNGYEFRTHCIETNFEVAYNGNNLLSILNTQYAYTGGAHPNYTRTSETFSLATGKKLSLTDILGLEQKEALEKVYATVTSQIKASEGTDEFFYFEDYLEGLRDYYSVDSFLLREDGLVFYYQLYAIAPYAFGFPEFKLPYEELGNTAMTIAPLPDNQHERDLYVSADTLLSRNREALFDIFGLAILQPEIPEDGIGQDTILPVKDTRFANYSELESFVRSTYVKKEADFLLNEHRGGIYYNRGGKIFVDISKDGGMGYYINWNDYRYELTDIKADSAVLQIYTTEESPAGTKEITLSGKLLKEDSSWLLEKMIQ
ncbi:MAG: DUF3298 and DUF4163 domain-containing protein [Bacillota bacterium]